MILDLRFPIGAMFTLFGLVLTIYGAASSPAIYAKSLGINVNLAWGAVMLLFGLIMAIAGWRAMRAQK
ncbi:hypothetical protein CCAX7_13430 [Capsulimonas corticalis]|uniref:Uncharacterized protein n=1 Tax=Capsulimonas corticalis TaxID=2219043 RepID=A0A402D4H4_9BACT|nr:hypothetical protein [Capsulimonas corticalis]BDI29292.1 hypothetical protein CCAX7_13430 [Capsulimonas corticalis]